MPQEAKTVLSNSGSSLLGHMVSGGDGKPGFLSKKFHKIPYKRPYGKSHKKSYRQLYKLRTKSRKVSTKRLARSSTGSCTRSPTRCPTGSPIGPLAQDSGILYLRAWVGCQDIRSHSAEGQSGILGGGVSKSSGLASRETANLRPSQLRSFRTGRQRTISHRNGEDPCTV